LLSLLLNVAFNIMTTEPCNIARIVFGNPEKGIISAQGFNAEFSGKNWDKLLSRSAIAGRHGAIDKTKLFYEENSQAIMLRPDLELKSMVDGVGYTTEDGSPAAKWEIKTIPGQPSLNLIYQYNVASKGWTVLSDYDLKENQGFMVYWQKLLTPKNSSSNLSFEIYLNPMEYISVQVEPRKKLYIDYGSAAGGGGQIWEKEIPASFYPTETISDNLNVLICLIVGDYIILGMGGLENTIALKCQDYYNSTDKNGKKYPSLTAEDSCIRVSGSGSILLGFKKLTYETEGSLSTPLMFPGYVFVAPPEGVVSKKITPTGASIDINGFSGGGVVEEEGQPGTDAEKQGVYANVTLKGDGNITPYLYRFKIHQSPGKITGDSVAQGLDTDILSYEESISGVKDGSFMSGSASVVVTCAGQFYPNLFMMRSPRVQYNLKLRGQEVEFLRAVHIVDIKEAERPQFGVFNLKLESRDITRELAECPLLESESYDDKGWRHGDLMQALADKGGATLISANYSSDPLLPVSKDIDSPNWQFQRGVKIWEAMSQVRRHSGWLLYPNSEGNLVYKPRPTESDSEDYTIDANAVPVTDVSYKLIDLYRTRILVWGKGAEDYEGKYPYKKGDNILGAGWHEGLENQIGRSRPLVIIDPLLSDWDSIEKRVGALYDYHTRDPFYISFQINDFENYGDMWIYKIIKWTDSKMNWGGIPLADKKFLITGVYPRIDKFSAIAMVEAVIL